MVGEQLAMGCSILEITRTMKMVAEGIGTTHSIVTLGDMHDVELPIAAQMDAVIHLGRRPYDAIQLLMERSLKNES
jgi:glycerol-3-phosphate dehydrogenase (NAD(P)+)